MSGRWCISIRLRIGRRGGRRGSGGRGNHWGRICRRWDEGASRRNVRWGCDWLLKDFFTATLRTTIHCSATLADPPVVGAAAMVCNKTLACVGAITWVLIDFLWSDLGAFGGRRHWPTRPSDSSAIGHRRLRYCRQYFLYRRLDNGITTPRSPPKCEHEGDWTPRLPRGLEVFDRSTTVSCGVFVGGLRGKPLEWPTAISSWNTLATETSSAARSINGNRRKHHRKLPRPLRCGVTTRGVRC